MILTFSCFAEPKQCMVHLAIVVWRQRVAAECDVTGVCRHQLRRSYVALQQTAGYETHRLELLRLLHLPDLFNALMMCDQ